MADLNVLIELINSAGVLGLLLFLLFCLIKGWLITKSQAEDIKATAKQSAETTARIVVSKLSERIEKHESCMSTFDLDRMMSTSTGHDASRLHLFSPEATSGGKETS